MEAAPSTPGLGQFTNALAPDFVREMSRSLFSIPRPIPSYFYRVTHTNTNNDPVLVLRTGYASPEMNIRPKQNVSSPRYEDVRKHWALASTIQSTKLDNAEWNRGVVCLRSQEKFA